MELTINIQTDSLRLATDAIHRFRKLQRTPKGNSVTSKACRRYAYEHGIANSEISGSKWPYEKR